MDNRKTKHVSTVQQHRLSDSSPDLLISQTPNQQAASLTGHGEGDSDSDLSDSERLHVPLSAHGPPQLDLRPEVINPEDSPSPGHRLRGQGNSGFNFPDCLPPPFNSWNLGQLAVFYNTEGRGAPRPRPVGPLERYLERMLQLEWHQIQTVQEESGKSTVSNVLAACHRSHSAAPSRLSSPKSILQCQRAFPLTFLSSVASHSALLSSCACTACYRRYTACGMMCGHSVYGRQSKRSPLLERRGPSGPLSVPKRSYSETRVLSSDKTLASRAQKFNSPVRGNNHMRHMQALGNIRNPVQGATTKSHSTARDSDDVAQRECMQTGHVLSGDCRSVGLRKRSGSEQRRGRTEIWGNGCGRRSGSECRKDGTERRRTSTLKEQEIKPDAITAIMDNLPASKHSSLSKPNRSKQVEFVT
ncbi:uncharacterized protein fam217bb [Lampris incognitus]|uniref:uncharacterized protein fam217bb n=1 Tax=Lampris incognitus TaxID=2546036 RepID=UPI0024B489C6|nr:uncharacterized protein fam217bb [Lampris incognitus]